MKFPLFLLCSILLSQTLVWAISPKADVCLLPSQTRESGEPPNVSSSCDHPWYELYNDKCYEPCGPGEFVSWTKDCLKNCPVRFRLNQNEEVCRLPSFEDGLLPFVDYHDCEKIHQKCATNTYGGFIPYCSSHNFGLSWRCKPERREREVIPARRSLTCQTGYELVNEVCYPQCPKGYQGVGKLCVSGQCPAGYTQRGKYCMKGTNCEGAQIENLENFMIFIQRAEIDFSQIDFSKYLC